MENALLLRSRTCDKIKENRTINEEMAILNGRDVRIGASLLVGDIERMARFYRDTLGFHTEWNGGDFTESETASGALSPFMCGRKEFVKVIGEGYIPPKGINRMFEVVLWLPSFVDADMEYERSSKLGLRFPTGESITYPFGIHNFHVADPEGNLLEIGSTNGT